MSNEDKALVPRPPNMDVLNRARKAVLGYRPHSTQWIKVAMLIMDAWPSIYAMARHLNEEVGLLRQAASGLPVAHLVEAPAGAHVVVHGVEVPAFPLGCAHDVERQRFIDAVNAAAAQPVPQPVATEESSAIDATLGLVTLPPIRVSVEQHAELQSSAQAQGVILQALVRDRLTAGQPVVQSFDFAANLQRQAEFSAKTFGPGARVQMVSDHIAKEL
jgi:hypothetical protein